MFNKPFLKHNIKISYCTLQKPTNLIKNRRVTEINHSLTSDKKT